MTTFGLRVTIVSLMLGAMKWPWSKAALGVLMYSVFIASAEGALVAHYSLDNNTSGIQNLGTNGSASDLAAYSGGSLPSFSPTGGFDGGGYASFSGTGQGLSTFQANNAAQDLTNYPYSFAAWVRSTVPPDYTATRATIMGVVRTAPNTTYTTLGMGFPDVANPGDLELVRRNTGFVANDAVGTRSILTDGAWHHVAAVMPTNNSIQLYVDGALWTTISPATIAAVNFENAINALEIGVLYRNSSGGGTASDFWIGDIDDVRLYDEALTAQQVAAIATVPEPYSLITTMIGLSALGLFRRCRR